MSRIVLGEVVLLDTTDLLSEWAPSQARQVAVDERIGAENASPRDRRNVHHPVSFARTTAPFASASAAAAWCAAHLRELQAIAAPANLVCTFAGVGEGSTTITFEGAVLQRCAPIARGTTVIVRYDLITSRIS